MTWSRIVPLALLILLTTCRISQSGWHDWYHQFWCDAERNNTWPSPYDDADREATRAPFEQMKDAGWRLEHTLVDALFTADQQLTYAGKLKIKNILTLSPIHRRTIFVLRAASPEATQQRVETVQQWAAEIATDGALPAVLVTDIAPRGGTGDYLNRISRRHREMIPPPVLPSQDAAGATTGTN